MQISSNLAAGDVLIRLLGTPDLASKRWIWEQYDHMVMADTLQRPGGDAAVVRVHGTNKAVAITTDCTPRYCKADPVEGGRQAVAEAWRNLTATGARPLAITDCMNFGNPERPEIMGQFVGCVEGMGEACRTLDFPVVSGNVSLYNETNGVGVLPTPDIGGVGLLDSLDHMATLAFKSEGEAILLVGETKGHLGASLYLREIDGREDGAPPPVDLTAERRNGDFVRTRIHAGSVSACHDVSDGGVLVALAEMAMAGNLGAEVDPAVSGLPAHAFLFGEDQARYVLTCRAADKDAVLAAAQQAGVPIAEIGRTGGRELAVTGETAVPVSRLKAAHERWFPDFMRA